jgi:uncharacterized protein (DUF1501 family)
MRASLPTSLPTPSRRAVLLGAGAVFAATSLPRVARADGRDPRFLAIVLRGGLDGLAVVAPVGDPNWQKLRGDKALTLDGATPALPLDAFFALNPAMPNLHRLYRAGEALFVQAVATPIASARISTARTYWKAAVRGPAPAIPAGSTARCRPWRRAGRERFTAGRRWRSGRSRRS